MSVQPSLEQRIRRLEDRDAIRDLTHRYCDLVWRNGGAAIADLFTEDGVFYPTVEREIRGREALRSFYADLAQRTANAPHPFIHNHVITINGDTAKMNCYIDNRFGDGSSTGGGYYDDELRRTTDGWKFTMRRTHRVFTFTFQTDPK